MEPTLNFRIAAVLLGLSVLVAFAFALGLESLAANRIAHPAAAEMSH